MRESRESIMKINMEIINILPYKSTVKDITNLNCWIVDYITIVRIGPTSSLCPIFIRSNCDGCNSIY